MVWKGWAHSTGPNPAKGSDASRVAKLFRRLVHDVVSRYMGAAVDVFGWKRAAKPQKRRQLRTAWEYLHESLVGGDRLELPTSWV